MYAHVGDRLVISSNRLGRPARRATVLERLGGDTVRVRWEDGTETVFVPGSDCRVERAARRGSVERFGCHIELRLVEDAHQCRATATLMTGRGTFEASGIARRHPDDPSVPMIGEELAIGRALETLAEQLLSEADDAIRRHEDQPLQLLDR